MNDKTTAIGALVLVLVLGLGIYFYNKGDNDGLDNVPGSTINIEENDNDDDLMNSTTSPYNTDGFEPTAS